MELPFDSGIDTSFRCEQETGGRSLGKVKFAVDSESTQDRTEFRFVSLTKLLSRYPVGSARILLSSLNCNLFRASAFQISLPDLKVRLYRSTGMPSN